MWARTDRNSGTLIYMGGWKTSPYGCVTVEDPITEGREEEGVNLGGKNQ